LCSTIAYFNRNNARYTASVAEDQLLADVLETNQAPGLAWVPYEPQRRLVLDRERDKRTKPSEILFSSLSTFLIGVKPPEPFATFQ
jgi:hypothetical protein